MLVQHRSSGGATASILQLHHPAAPRYLAAPQNTPGVRPPSIRLSIRPSILRSLEFGLGGCSVATDVEQQQEAEAERGGGAHGQGLAQHQQRVDGTWKRQEMSRGVPGATSPPPRRLSPIMTMLSTKLLISCSSWGPTASSSPATASTQPTAARYGSGSGAKPKSLRGKTSAKRTNCACWGQPGGPSSSSEAPPQAPKPPL